MSDPVLKHPSRDGWDYRLGSQYVPARFAQMSCDGGQGLGCKNSVARAPRLQVPPKPWIVGGPKNLRMMTTLHYCEAHAQNNQEPMRLLHQPKVIADFERIANLKWPHGFKPDFDAAWIEWVLVTTPEYRQFLEAVEINRFPRELLV